MGKILAEHGNIPLAIGGTGDHVHLLFAYTAKDALPDLVRELKINTTKFINTQNIMRGKFAWQRGYACFSASQSGLENVKHYVNTQYEHHRGMSLVDEVKRFLQLYNLPFDERYIFSEPE